MPTPTPPKNDVPAESYAILVEPTQIIFRATSNPFSSGLKWNEIENRPIDTVPKSSYENAEWIMDQGNIWFYVEDIQLEEQIEDVESVSSSNSEGKYQITIEDSAGNQYNVGDDLQSSAFASALEILIKEYSLTDQIDLPWVPGYKNAILAEEPRHPNGEEMERNKPILNGQYHISTQPTKEQKRNYLEQFATLTGVSIEFGNAWEE